MPVSVPRLQKFQSAPQAKSGRINFQAQSVAPTIQKNISNISKLADDAIDLYVDIEDSKIEQMSNENELEYKAWNTNQLNNLRAIKGDPTDAYAQYELDEREKSEAILNKRPDISERAKRHVSSNFAKSQAGQRVQTLKQRGLQQETYASNIYNATLQSKQNDLPLTASSIKEGNKDSFFAFKRKVDDITDHMEKRGLVTGTITKDKKGKLKRSPLFYKNLNIALNESITNSVKILSNSGHDKEAKMLRDEYKDHLNGKNLASLEKVFNTNDVQKEAYAIVNKHRNPDELTKALNKMPESAVKTEVQKIKTTNENRIESDRKAKSTKNYDTLANHIINKMKSANPYHGISQLEADPLYKETWDNITIPSQKKALLELLEPPKETNSKSEARIQNLFFGNDEEFQIDTITPSEFATYTAGLNEKAKSRYISLFNSMRTETSGEERSTFRRAEKFLFDELFVANYIKKDDFGKLNKRSEKRLIEARNELIDYLSKQYGTFSDKDLKDFVKDYSAKKVADEVFKPEPRRTFKKRTKNPEETMDEKQILEARRAYKKEYRKWPDFVKDPKHYYNFVRNNL